VNTSKPSPPSRLKGGMDVLELDRELKQLSQGTVSLNGTHIRASASKNQNVNYKHEESLFSV
jgi:hypothetical protein